MVDALFDINDDGGDQGFDATINQVLTLHLRTRPSSARSVQFQVWNAAAFDRTKDPLYNPPRKSKGAPDLTLVGGTSGRLVSPVGIDGSVTVTMPSTKGWGWIVRCIVDNGMTRLADGRLVLDLTKIHERMIVIRDDNGARPIISTETTQYEDDGWAGAFITATSGVQGPTGAQGPASVGRAIQIPYTFSSETADADPGAGFLRLNGSENQEDSTTLRLSLFDSTGTIVTPTLALGAARKNVRLRKADDPSKWMSFKVTAMATPADYRNLTISVAVSGKTDTHSPYNPFEDGDQLVLCFDDLGSYHVADFGAVALFFSDPHPLISDALPIGNTAALRAAGDTAHALGGGTVNFSASVYYTADWWGYDVNADTNGSVKFKGAGGFPATLIFALSNDQPNLKLHARTPNLRFVDVEDIQFEGGRQNLSLEIFFYSRFTNCFFWGAQQFAVQMHESGDNVFHGCYWNELVSAGSLGDALYIQSSHVEIIACTVGESGGGIVNQGGFLQLTGGRIFQSWYKGSPYTDYWTDPDAPADVSLSGAVWFAEKPTLVASAEFGLQINGTRISSRYLGLYCEYSHRIVVDGVFWDSEPVVPGDGHFVGFIKCYNYVGDTALKISGQFILTSNGSVGDSGYFINEPSNLLHDAVIDAQVIVQPGCSLTPLSSSAPALLNPGSENNLVNLRVFHSTSV